MSNKIWIVKATESGALADDKFDYIVGYCKSEKDAEAECKKLKRENRKTCKFWNQYGRNCLVECEAWPSEDDLGAIDALKKTKRNKCPYADLEIKELFYGKDNKSGGFEIFCKNKSDKCYNSPEYEYEIEEVELIS